MTKTRCAPRLPATSGSRGTSSSPPVAAPTRWTSCAGKRSGDAAGHASSGYQCHRAGARAARARLTLAILMLTAAHDATTAALCVQRGGAMDYVTEPLDLEHLTRAVSRALQRRHKAMEDTRIERWLSDDVHLRSVELRREQETLERLSVATSRRWSTRWKRRMPTCAVIRRGWPTSWLGWRRNSACRMRTWR